LRRRRRFYSGGCSAQERDADRERGDECAAGGSVGNRRGAVTHFGYQWVLAAAAAIAATAAFLFWRLLIART